MEFQEQSTQPDAQRTGGQKRRRLPMMIGSGVLIVALISAMLVFPARALAAYSAGLVTPTAPSASATFVWNVEGTRSRQGGQIGYVQLSGCWTADQVVSVAATDNRGRSLLAVVSASGSTANSILVLKPKDRRMPIIITVTFIEPYARADNGTRILIRAGLFKKNKTIIQAAGPTCTPPSSTVEQLIPAGEPTVVDIGDVTIVFKEDSLSEDAILKVEILPPPTVDNPDLSEPLSDTYSIELLDAAHPDGPADIEEPVHLIYHYGPSMFGNPADAQYLTFATDRDSPSSSSSSSSILVSYSTPTPTYIWNPVPTTVDIDANTATTSTTHFSRWSIFLLVPGT